MERWTAVFPVGTTTMISQTRMLLGTIGLLAFGMSASSAPARDQQGACGQIMAACLGAGFVQGAAREGIGLQVHCMMPIMQAKAQLASARKPLPKVDPQLVADCKVSNLRFGPPLSPPAEIAEPLSASAAPPGRDIVLRPGAPTASVQTTARPGQPPKQRSKAAVAERPAATPLSGPPPQGSTAEAQTSKTDATASKSTTGTIPVTPAATALARRRMTILAPCCRSAMLPMRRREA